MGKKKNRGKNGHLTPPKGASAYFRASSDAEFKRKHPVGYVFLAILGIAALVAPMLVYDALVSKALGGESNIWLLLGGAGALAIGIGLFNFVAIIIRQYLGHLVSILAFAVGALFIWISLVQMGIA